VTGTANRLVSSGQPLVLAALLTILFGLMLWQKTPKPTGPIQLDQSGSDLMLVENYR
jgi:hypothetical protein